MSDSTGWSLAAVHIPKTAGTSFREALQRIYGERMRLDNDTRPLSRSRWRRRSEALGYALAHAGRSLPEACVYGHFLPLKYASQARVRFSVWLRDPVQRVVSRYHHYVRHADSETHHLRWGLVPGLTLEQFARIPQYQNTYAEYLWMFPVRRFDFIGIVEHYDQDVGRFAQRFGLAGGLRVERRNANPGKAAARYEIAPAVERLIRARNAKDLALYEYACELRQRMPGGR